MTYTDLATKLLNDELEYIHANPVDVCKEYDWDKIDKFAHKHVKRLIINEFAVDYLAAKIKEDHEINNLWQTDIDGCQFDDLMAAEYIDLILKDFLFQIRTFTIGIPLFND